MRISICCGYIYTALYRKVKPYDKPVYMHIMALAGLGGHGAASSKAG